jgi:uncharacterized protein (DUF111 family)
MLKPNRLASGGKFMRRIRRIWRAASAFLTQLGVALLKTIVTSLAVGIVVISVMHYMGVPVPAATELLRGVSKLAHILS